MQVVIKGVRRLDLDSLNLVTFLCLNLEVH